MTATQTIIFVLMFIGMIGGWVGYCIQRIKWRYLRGKLDDLEETVSSSHYLAHSERTEHKKKLDDASREIDELIKKFIAMKADRDNAHRKLAAVRLTAMVCVQEEDKQLIRELLDATQETNPPQIEEGEQA